MDKNKNSNFKKFLRVVFVENWGLKVFSLFAAALLWLMIMVVK